MECSRGTGRERNPLFGGGGRVNQGSQELPSSLSTLLMGCDERGGGALRKVKKGGGVARYWLGEEADAAAA